MIHALHGQSLSEGKRWRLNRLSIHFVAKKAQRQSSSKIGRDAKAYCPKESLLTAGFLRFGHPPAPMTSDLTDVFELTHFTNVLSENEIVSTVKVQNKMKGG